MAYKLDDAIITSCVKTLKQTIKNRKNAADVAEKGGVKVLLHILEV